MLKNLEEIFHSVSIIVFSYENQQIMCGINSDSGEYFIPFTKTKTDTFKKTVFKYISEISGITIEGQFEVLKVYKIWFPYISKDYYLNHIVVSLSINMQNYNKISKSKTKAKGFSLFWTKISQLKHLVYTFKFQNGNEILNFVNYLSPIDNIDSKNILINFPEGSWNSFIGDNDSAFVEIHFNQILFNGGKLSQLLVQANFKTDEIVSLYLMHLLYSFPSLFMGLNGFSHLLSKLSYPKGIHSNLFNAADISRRHALSFRELLFFFAACEPDTKHENIAANYRNMYIFCFFDNDCDGLLDAKEIKLLEQNMQALENVSDADIKLFINLIAPSPIKINQFLKACVKFPQMSQMLRSPKSILTISSSFVPKKTPNLRASLLVKPKQMENEISVKTTQDITFEVAMHSIKVTGSGKILEVDHVECPEGGIELSKEHRTNSINLFQNKDLAAELLFGLRYFGKETSDSKRVLKQAYNWGEVDLIGFGKRVIHLCTKVREIFMKEPRLLKLSSPIYVLGDIHGNFHDLMQYEKLFWKEPIISPCTFLFLGDLVDRGEYGIEVVSYLFTCKLLNPEKFCFVRGNHEIRYIQEKFTFLNECNTRFGLELGNKVWEAINDVFDCFPLAAIINEKVFCCHGGIPPPWLCPNVSAINYIPVPLKCLDEATPLAWDLVWNDPITPDKINEKQYDELKVNEGFATNVNRGTGHFFNQAALNRFLNNNRLTHVIRAHEVQQTGSSVIFKGKLITVFSSSHYCGKDNEAACIFIDNKRLRVIKVETHYKNAIKKSIANIHTTKIMN